MIVVVVVGGGLALFVRGGTSATRTFTTVASSIDSPDSTTTVPPPVADPVAPAGFSLHRDNFRGYVIALPDGWIEIDIGNAASIDTAFEAAKEQHPDRAASLDNLRAITPDDAVFVAVAPISGALVTNLTVAKRPPLHGITNPRFIDSLEQSMRALNPDVTLNDLTVTPTTIAARPAVIASFHTTKALSTGATDEAFHYTAMVEGTTSDFTLSMTTDTPDDSKPFFDQAAATLTPLR